MSHCRLNQPTRSALVDEIIVLKNGSVAERGRHSELVLAGGLYTDSLEAEHGRARGLDDWSGCDSGRRAAR